MCVCVCLSKYAARVDDNGGGGVGDAVCVCCVCVHFFLSLSHTHTNTKIYMKHAPRHVGGVVPKEAEQHGQAQHHRQGREQADQHADAAT